MESGGLFTLDAHSGIRLSYLAEGAANIVYQIVHPPASPSTEADLGFSVDQAEGALPGTPPPTEISPTTIDPRLQGKLIRLRKNLLTTVPVTESWNHFQNVVIPLFLGSQLVSQTLFKISREFVRSLNDELRFMEEHGRRDQERHGVYVDENERYGTLVSDMSSDEWSMSIEFKPKWLVQSPNAPEGSKRCRTCALRAMKQGRNQGTRRGDDSKIGFCPLSLISGDRSKVAGIVEQFLGSSRFSDFDRLRVGDQLIKFFAHFPLLQRLRQLQKDLDPRGVLEADLQSQNFLTAMTIRDCTLFLKVGIPCPIDSYADHVPLQIPRSCSGAVEARLGDLDLKSSHVEKAEYWKATERRLIDEGWYTCTERRRVNEDNECFLAASGVDGG